MSILELLYEDCTSFCDRMGYNSSKEYKAAQLKASELEKKLYTHFTEEVKTLYEDVRLAQLELSSIEDLRYFKKAFVYGALLMLEILLEGDSNGI